MEPWLASAKRHKFWWQFRVGREYTSASALLTRMRRGIENQLCEIAFCSGSLSFLTVQ
jgi:hypothetical protein